MSKQQKPPLTRAMLEPVAHLSSSEAGKVLGYSKTAVTESRQRLGMKRDKALVDERKKVEGKSSKFEMTKDGSLLVETTDEVPQTKDHIDERMRARGFDPERYSFAYRFSEWEALTADGVRTMYAARASATERKMTTAEVLSADDLISVVENYTPVRGEQSDAPASGSFFFNFADPQFGKTDLNGGTDETIQRFMASLDHACAILDESPAQEIIWSDLGDGIENFCNTSSQRQTNDLNLVEQVRILRRIQVEGLLRLSEYAPVTHVSVPSNHSQNRVGFQQPASTSHDDWGLEVQQQLFELFEHRETANPIMFVQPPQHLESVAINLVDGTRVGFVHGHRSNSQDGLERWWAGQALGRQPTYDADILLVGHFHNLSVRTVGDKRYIITAPSLDNGSSWFTVSRGNVATAGVLTMRVLNGFPHEMRIV